ncbi:MAG: hypothetical protein PUG07_00215 [Ruminococcus sp.]|nr:hypothetical protein [Ruminococcus sp.]
MQKPERAALFPVFVWEWYQCSARVNLAKGFGVLLGNRHSNTRLSLQGVL